MDKLLLLSCCAPCSVGVIADLAQRGQDFTVMFFNPNIHPKAEYSRRLQENKRVCEELKVPFIEGKYVPKLWQRVTQGLETEPERGKRCDQCFYLRLKIGALYAKKHGFTRISSVFGISRFKDFDQVCRAGKLVEGETGVFYDAINWRKNGGLEFTERLGKEKKLYRQTYCGCQPKK